MKSFIKSLSSNQELFLVLGIAFGYSIYLSNYSLYYHLFIRSESTWIYKISTKGVLSLSLRCFTSLLIGWFVLKNRDYKLGDFNLRFSWSQLGYGFLLYYIMVIFIHIIFSTSKLIAPSFLNFANNQVTHKETESMLSIFLLLLLGPISEEIFLNGYLFKRLERLKPKFVILISLAIRISYHTYLGWACLLFVLPFGIVLTLYYSRYKKLWPVILAHIINNFFAHFYYYTHQ